jgi:hypothetical protein
MQTGRRAVSAEGEEQRQQSDKGEDWHGWREQCEAAGRRAAGRRRGGREKGRRRGRDETRQETRDERDETRLGWAGMGTWGASWEREGEQRRLALLAA